MTFFAPITCQNSPFLTGGGNYRILPLGAAVLASVKNICFIHKLVRWLENSRRTGFGFVGVLHRKGMLGLKTSSIFVT